MAIKSEISLRVSICISSVPIEDGFLRLLINDLTSDTSNSFMKNSLIIGDKNDGYYYV